jgi:hypothetical protein
VEENIGKNVGDSKNLEMKRFSWNESTYFKPHDAVLFSFHLLLSPFVLDHRFMNSTIDEFFLLDLTLFG